jgi:hypothetical protein
MSKGRLGASPPGVGPGSTKDTEIAVLQSAVKMLNERCLSSEKRYKEALEDVVGAVRLLAEAVRLFAKLEKDEGEEANL